MKKILHTSLLLVLTILLAGCDSFFSKPKFDATLLAGHWLSGTVHEYFNANGTGYTWDTADDVTEDEAQPFTWSLTNANLTLNHKMEMGGVVPKSYTVTKLNATTLSYHDNYGVTYTFIRQ